MNSPLIGGISISHFLDSSGSGTLGIIIEKKNSNKKFGISTNHTVARAILKTLII